MHQATYCSVEEYNLLKRILANQQQEMMIMRSAKKELISQPHLDHDMTRYQNVVFLMNSGI